jgi:hypothetical protein
MGNQDDCRNSQNTREGLLPLKEKSKDSRRSTNDGSKLTLDIGCTDVAVAKLVPRAGFILQVFTLIFRCFKNVKINLNLNMNRDSLRSQSLQISSI